VNFLRYSSRLKVVKLIFHPQNARITQLDTERSNEKSQKGII